MRAALPLTLLTLVLGIAWLATRSDEPPLPRVGGEERAPVREDTTTPELAPRSSGRESAESAPPAEEVVDAAADLVVLTPTATGEGDLEATVPIVLKVVDEDEAPVADASVRIWAMRSVENPGSHSLYRGEEPLGVTDRAGRVELEHWAWVDVDGRTGQVTLRIEHPDYVTFTDDVAIGPGEHVVHLTRGATVVVTGWYREPSNVIRDLKVLVDRESQLGPDGWKPLDDGRLATTKIPPGRHWLVASHADPELGLLSSAAEAFEVGEVGWETLHVELHAPLELVGELDANVPRPVVDGHVMLVLRAGGVGGEPVLSQRFEAAIRADGSFVLTGLRPGSGQVLALCRGWSSLRTLADDPLQAGIHLDPSASAEERSAALQRAGERAYILQRAEVPQVETPFPVLMERTGTLEVTVLAPSGAPLEGATVSASPNVHVVGVGAWIFPWRTWNANTGPDGVARIEDLPPDSSLWFSAGAKGMRMTAELRVETPWTEIVSGETARAELRLEDGDE